MFTIHVSARLKNCNDDCTVDFIETAFRISDVSAIAFKEIIIAAFAVEDLIQALSYSHVVIFIKSNVQFACVLYASCTVRLNACIISLDD